MGVPDRRRTGPLPTGPLPFDTGAIAEVVPARAVLTELARGFLLTNAADPERAKRFAATFLREQQGPLPAPRLGPYRLVPTPRRSADPPPPRSDDASFG